MCIWDSFVYQKSALCFLIHKSYIRSIKRYCFVRKYAAIPLQLEIVILHYIGWCVLIIWTFILNEFSCFCQLLLLLLLLLLLVVVVVVVVVVVAVVNEQQQWRRCTVFDY
jgi:hypothetical protein